ncbi:MAG: hypothetical protein F6K48_09055 [Okeania sp. SIO3H1]|uniref:hypothetical protein n=1 Tax=Okeania sp. SIO1I7 TaxID=2607772 RepID=UPI0013CDBA3F|nr:hypothetical protein [Okeania sp. SIO1I7]NEN89045.1 hypothetical protein [Okeania sp. SIO3H1]NET25203.1 hypothetical protein [Okeania sp. SIO1I7]
MEIYIESRGFSQDDDYRWLKITEESQARIDKQDLPTIIQEATQLIDSESASVVLSRKNNSLLCLLTGIEPTDRVDFADRQIRISIAWVISDSTDNERTLRMLAAAALNTEERQHFTVEISQVVSLGGELGFQVDFQHIQELTNTEKAKKLLQDKLPNTTNKIAEISLQRQQELALELKEYRLPTQQNLIVVVTGIKKEQTLIDADIWRGLSSLVLSSDWQIVNRTLSDKNLANKLSKYFNNLMIIIGVISAVSLLAKTLNFF